MKAKELTHSSIWDMYEMSHTFNQSIGLYETVRTNENYFIGKQWENVQANGLPTPVFNFLKRVTLFQVATITSDNMKIQASPLPSTSSFSQKEIERITEIINHQFDSIFERNRIVTKTREFMRNAAVDGDGCMYFYFDPDVENGQPVKGEIQAEVIENTRVWKSQLPRRAKAAVDYHLAPDAFGRSPRYGGRKWRQGNCRHYTGYGNLRKPIRQLYK